LVLADGLDDMGGEGRAVLRHDISTGVVMSNGNMPWMAIRSAGKGRVIACAGTLMGSPSPGKTMYYEWEGWLDCLWRMIQWASGK
ncbi:MAG: hypothetical protein KKD33_03480, partial [Verrucomicrobia bacterium]|nr:hypothetical protein [Verrucomicrobiota bacterium]